MDDHLIASTTIAWLAFALGVIFGFVGNKTNFCTLGAISDAMNIGDWGRMRMWALAMAVAIVGATALQLGGLIDLHKSIYTGPRLLWLSHIVGGLLFGAGMTLASGCGSKSLIRIGTGNLKSLVVFVFLGIAAYMTLRGLFGTWRVAALDSVGIDLGSTQDIPAILSRQTGLAADIAIMITTAIVGGGLGLFALASRDAWRSDILIGGLVIGAVVVAGWYVSGHVGFVAEHPDTLEEAFIGTNSGRMETFTFVAPYAFSLELLMFWSDTSKIVTFGIAAVLGVTAGSALYALLTRSFRLESFRDANDLLRHLSGAIMMGFGGVTALGCTIGQGISGVSTLALGSLITTAAIIAGSALTMKIEYWKMMREG